MISNMRDSMRYLAPFGNLLNACRAETGDPQEVFAATASAIAAGVLDDHIPRSGLTLCITWINYFTPGSDVPSVTTMARVAQAVIERQDYHLAYVSWMIAHYADRLLRDATDPAERLLLARAWRCAADLLAAKLELWPNELLFVTSRVAECFDRAERPGSSLNFRLARAIPLIYLRRWHAALEVLVEEASRVEAGGDSAQRAGFHALYAQCLTRMGKLDEALAHHTAAVKAVAGTSDPSLDAMLRITHAMPLRLLGRLDEAIDELVTALPVLRRRGRFSDYPLALLELAACLMDRGQPEQALALAHTLQRPPWVPASSALIVQLALLRGEALIDLGRSGDALRATEEALGALQPDEGSDLRALVLMQQARALQNLGRSTEAIAVSREAVLVLGEYDNRAIYAQCLVTLAQCLALIARPRSDTFAEAVALFKQALVILEGVARVKFQACLTGYGTCLYFGEEFEDAERQFCRAVESIGPNGNATLYAVAVHGRALCLEKLERYGESLDCFAQAIAGFQRSAPAAYEHLWRAHYNRAMQLWLHWDKIEEAREDIARARDIVESIAAGQVSYADRFSLRGTYADVYRVAAVINATDPETFYRYAQVAKARTFAELRAMSAYRPLAAALAQDGLARSHPASVQRRLWGTLARAAATLVRLAPPGTHAPDDGPAAAPDRVEYDPATLRQLRGCLGNNEAFLDCLTMPHGSIAFMLITKDEGVVSTEILPPDTLPLALHDLQQAVADCVAHADDPEPLPRSKMTAELARVREQLFGLLVRDPEAAKVLARIALLFVSPSDRTYQIAWSALAQLAGTPETSAETPFAVAVVPSATALWSLRDARQPSAGVAPQLLALAPFHAATSAADGWWTGALPLSPLTRSRALVEGAAALVARYPGGRSALYIAQEATRDVLIARAPAANILFIVTHGARLGEGDVVPDFGLFFHPDAEGPDPNYATSVTMHELLGGAMRLAPGCHVVLAACQLGDAMASGEEALGLAQAMLHVGASTCLAPLWSVDEGATQKLSSVYLAELLAGRPPSIALREAMTAVRNDRRWRHPFYWAGFILLGDGAHASFGATRA